MRIEIKKAFLSRQTIKITFRILDEDRQGFQPDTLTLTIYDLTLSAGFPTTYRTLNPQVGEAVGSVIVNDQDGADVLAFCNAQGEVSLTLTPEDTEVPVPARLQAIYLQRRLRFLWTWGSPANEGLLEIFISIAPDRATVAA